MISIVHCCTELHSHSTVSRLEYWAGQRVMAQGLIQYYNVKMAQYEELGQCLQGGRTGQQ